MRRIATSILLLAALAPAFAQAPPGLPIETVRSEALRLVLEFETVISQSGWYLMGVAPEGYRAGAAVTPGMTGKLAGFLQACDMRALGGHGAIEHTIPAAGYAGKRVRVVARTRKEGRGTAAFYMTALGRDAFILLGISRQETSTTDWQVTQLVMNVPERAEAMEVGFVLQGSMAGRLWIDNVVIEIVDQSVPTAGRVMTDIFQRDPNNLPVSCDGVRD